jgi:hypothetical protein
MKHSYRQKSVTYEMYAAANICGVVAPLFMSNAIRLEENVYLVQNEHFIFRSDEQQPAALAMSAETRVFIHETSVTAVCFQPELECVYKFLLAPKY